MTPQEKAKELVDNFDISEQLPNYSIKHALILVNEILYVLNEVSEQDDNTYAYNAAVFYNQVKTELKKL